MAMSHTSEFVSPTLGAISTYSPLCESKTATFETLATTVPLRCLTWVNLPPTQMLVPTCSMARTVPLTIGVWSGVSEGKASATPQAKSMARAIEDSSTTILLIPSTLDRKSTRLNSSHANISYAVFCLKKNIRSEVHLSD